MINQYSAFKFSPDHRVAATEPPTEKKEVGNWEAFLGYRPGPGDVFTSFSPFM